METVLLERENRVIGTQSKKKRVILKSSPAHMISEEDIRELLVEWGKVPAWIKKQVSIKEPAYRYQGELFIEGDTLVFAGRDNKERQDFLLAIPLHTMSPMSAYGSASNSKVVSIRGSAPAGRCRSLSSIGMATGVIRSTSILAS